MKVRKKDEELKLIAPSLKAIVDIAEKIVAGTLGDEFDIQHRVNLYLGEHQHFANNPRSKKMYIQYAGIVGADEDPAAEIKNLYISGILHEIGHSYLKIENALRRARQSIASEGLANVFGLILMDEVCGRLDPKSWLVKNEYPSREKKWYADVFKEKKGLPYPLETTRFFYTTMDRTSLFETIRRFNLKHRTYREFEEILGSVLGEKARKDFALLMDSFDLDEYAAKYKKKV